MLTITAAQLHEWLSLFLWPFVRLTSFMLAAPLFGHHSIPRLVKLGLALAITLAIAPGLAPMPQVPIWSWAGFGIVAQQMLVGVALGLVLRVVFAATMVAGDYVGLQMGLAFATTVSPDTGASTMVVARFFYLISLL